MAGFNHCFITALFHSDGTAIEISHCMDEIRSPLRSSVEGRHCSLLGTQRTVPSLHRWTPLLRPLLCACWVAVTQHRETLLVEIRTDPWRSSSQSTSADMDWLPYRWAQFLRILNKNRVSLYARAITSYIFLFFSFFILQRKNKILITTFSLFRGYFSTFSDRGDQMVMIVVQYPLHVHKTNALSSSSSCFHTPNRCCCRT